MTDGVHCRRPNPDTEGMPRRPASTDPANFYADAGFEDGYEAFMKNVRSGPLRENVDFDERPFQVVIGFTMVLVLVAWAFYPSEYVRVHLLHESLPGASFRMAMWAALVFSIVYGSLISNNTLMVRPHPMVWRALHGWNLWYCIMVVMILVIPVSDGDVVLDWIFPKGRVTQEGGSVGFDHLKCEINQDTLMRQIKSIWFMAHLLGWCAKMLMLRDWKMCIIYSTAFELAELTLQCLIPEFQECWWDSLFMDWGGANMVGMCVGSLLLRFLDAKPYRWQRLGDTKGLKNLASRGLMQLTPAAWQQYEWNPSGDPRGVILNATIWIVMGIGEVNSFFLLNILRLPNEHIFNKSRQVLFVFTAMPAVAEWYHYVKGHTNRIGHFTWLLFVTVALETAAVLKYWTSLTRVPIAAPSFEIWAPWLATASIFSTYFCLHCVWRFIFKSFTIPAWLRVLRAASFLPLLSLGRLYAF